MERLTKRSEDKYSTMVWFVDKESWDMRYEPCEMDSHQRRKVLCKLADYEDAEEQGLLYRTKVAIGQTVYTNIAVSGWYLRCKDRPYKAKVVFMGLNDSEEMGGGFFNVEYEKGYMMAFNFSDIGKTVFLTREEAEQALKQIGE